MFCGIPRGAVETMKALLRLFVAWLLLLVSPLAMPAEDGATPLDLLEFEIRGNTVLPQEAIEQAVYPFLGPKRSMNDLENARAALEKAYRDAGYLTVYVDIPEQQVADGLIKLRVTEGKVERMRVSGAQYTLPSRIRSEVPAVQEGEVPYFPGLQHDLAVASSAPGVRVLPVMQAGRAPGTVDVELKVEDSPPVSAWAGVNNAYSVNTATERVYGGVRYGNLFQRSHAFSMQYQTAPSEPGQTSALTASYTVPFGEYRRFLSLYGVHSESNVAVLGDTTSVGNGDIFGARLLLSMPARPHATHNLSLGIDYKDFQEGLLLGGTPTIETPIHYWTLNATYGVQLQDEGGSWQFGVGTVLGLRGLGADEAAFNSKRYLSRADFSLVRLDVQRDQKLPADWGLSGRLDLQLADQPLVSNEQFSAGGVGSVRGYLLSEALGDWGVRGSLELRTPALVRPSWHLARRIQPFLFVDGAYLQTIDALPAQKDSYALLSAGLGLQMEVRKGLSLDLNLAVPMRDTRNTQAGHPRIHFDTRLTF